jgi:(R,R)-butanediol dehydrogenase/meso-butanediol dehydrogenase/diacetyl reductase
VGRKHAYTGVELPVTMGHEFSGTVTETGSNVKHLPIGQDVTVNPTLDDRFHGLDPCASCQVEKYNICTGNATYGLSAPGGGFSDEIVVNAISCIPLPTGVSLKVAALVEPLSVAWHCIDVSGFKAGQAAFIAGAGPIGLAILILLRVIGASKIVVGEVLPSRMEQARNFGADAVINPLEKTLEGGDPILAAVLDLTGEGVHVAFDATGLQSTLDQAIACTRAGGTIFNVAIHEKPLLLNLNDLATKEKKLAAGICYTIKDFEAVVALLGEKKIDAEKMITSVVPLSKVVDGGFGELINNKAAHVKILIQPGA